MAKSKFPKKTNGVSEAVPTLNSTPSAANSGSAAAAAPALESNAATTKNTTTRRPAKKPEIVKSEPRANLLPINLEEEVRRLAYLLSERRGFESGHEAEDWLEAEREIRQRYHQHTA